MAGPQDIVGTAPLKEGVHPEISFKRRAIIEAFFPTEGEVITYLERSGFEVKLDEQRKTLLVKRPEERVWSFYNDPKFDL